MKIRIAVLAAALSLLLVSSEAAANAVRWTSPLKGACRLSSPFGPRGQPCPGCSKNHLGTDMAAPCGTPVYAPAPGRVVDTFFSAGGGKTIVIQHADGTRTRYLHLSSIDTKPGATVGPDTQIGRVGTTGKFSNGCHLHFETIRNGAPFNSRTLISNPCDKGRTAPVGHKWHRP